MRIIHCVLGKADPERMNGVNKVVHHLASAQHDLGAEVEIWGITKTPNKAPAVDRPFPTLLFSKQRNRFSTGNELRAAIANADPQTCFHMHGGFIPEWSGLSKQLDQFSLPYAFTAHGSYNTIAMLRSKWRKKLYMQFFERPMLRKAKVVHCIGQSEMDASRQIVAASRMAVIPNGQQALLPSKISLGKEPLFVFCGRLDLFTKGLDLLFRGFAAYLATGGTGKLALIGDGGDREQLQALAKKLAISEEVDFHGAMFGEEKLKLIKQADAFVHPSRNEGMPTAVLEAAASAVPSIVSYETNVGTFIEEYDAGITLAENTAAQITAALHEVKSWRADESRLELVRKNALKMREQEFDWKIIAQKLMEAYAA